MKKQVLVFGAGNIGRSFIAPVFLEASYEVIFVDINKSVVAELNRTGKYSIHICSTEKDFVKTICGYRALHLSDTNALFPLLCQVPLIITCVGQAGLNSIATVTGKMLPHRMDECGEYVPLDIILAENLRNAAGFFRQKIIENMQGDFPVDSHLGLVETSIGKMVSAMSQDEQNGVLMQLRAEEYNILILDKAGFVGAAPESSSIKLVSPIQAWVDRKLFIHNLGHAACAYLGRYYYPDETLIAPLLENCSFCAVIREVMREGSHALEKLYPDVFTTFELENHIDDLLFRFANPLLADSIRRVGTDLPRKLGRDDRIVGAMRAAVRYNLPITYLCRVYLAALTFGKSSADESDRDVFQLFSNEGIEVAYLQYSCGEQQKPDVLDEEIVAALSHTQFIPDPDETGSGYI